MSSKAIVKFEDATGLMFQCHYDSYPAGLGFDLLEISEKDHKFISFLCNDPNRFQAVLEVPKDISYEYIIQKDGQIHCQENWYAFDKSYHGGGFRYGKTYNLKESREKVRLQSLYSYRREEAWK